MITEDKPTCHVKIGGYYLREIKDFADLSFGESFLDVKLDRINHKFVVWIEENAEKKAIKKFEEKFKQCVIRIFEEKTKK